MTRDSFRPLYPSGARRLTAECRSRLRPYPEGHHGRPWRSQGCEPARPGRPGHRRMSADQRRRRRQRTCTQCARITLGRRG